MRLRFEKITGNSKLPSEGQETGCVCIIQLTAASIHIVTVDLFLGGGRVIMGEGFTSQSQRTGRLTLVMSC